jgi:hypothetical protein
MPSTEDEDRLVELVDSATQAVQDGGEVLIDLGGELLGAPSQKRARLKLFSFLKSCDNTRVLKLPKNELGGSECQLLSEVLRFSKSITFIDLSGNSLAGEGNQLNFAGVEALFESVGKNTTLTNLDLSSTNLGGWNGKHGNERRIDGAGAECLTRLTGNKSLRKLTLRSNHLSATGVAAVAAAVSGTAIQDLNVADNEMLGFWANNTDGLLGLASLFEANESLTNLNMTSNSLYLMDRSAGEGLSKALAIRTSSEPDEDMELGAFDEMMEVGLLCTTVSGAGLTRLDLSGELLGAAGCLVVASLVKSAPGLEMLSLRKCAICSYFQDDMGCHTHGTYSTYGIEALLDAISTRNMPADQEGKEGEQEDEDEDEDEDRSQNRTTRSGLLSLSLADNGLFGFDRHGDSGEFDATVVERLVGAVASSALTSLDLSWNYGGTSALAGVTTLVASSGALKRGWEQYTCEDVEGFGETRYKHQPSGEVSSIHPGYASSLQHLDLSRTALHEHDSHQQHMQEQDALWMGKLMSAFEGNAVLKTIRLIGIKLNDLHGGDEQDNRTNLCDMCRDKGVTLYLCDEPYQPFEAEDVEDAEGVEASEETAKVSKKGGSRAGGSKAGGKTRPKPGDAKGSSKKQEKTKRQFGDPKSRDVDLLVFEEHESDSSESESEGW